MPIIPKHIKLNKYVARKEGLRPCRETGSMSSRQLYSRQEGFKALPVQIAQRDLMALGLQLRQIPTLFYSGQPINLSRIGTI